jgi:type VI secretion system secreted protein Hcp
MAFDAFLKIEGIEGESTDKTHPGEIEVSSFSWGVSNPTSIGSGGGGGGAGKAAVQDFHFGMATSKASPNLMLACATGRRSPSATLTLRRGTFEFVKIRLSDCIVSSYDLGGDNTSASDNPNSPLDQMSLAFAKIDFLYTVQRTGEMIETTFDLRGDF